MKGRGETKLKATHIKQCTTGLHNVASEFIDTHAQNTGSVET